jgi:hypothetical protein
MLSMGMCMSGVYDQEESSTAEAEAGRTVDDARHCDQTKTKTKTKMTIPACMPLQSTHTHTRAIRCVWALGIASRQRASSPK